MCMNSDRFLYAKAVILIGIIAFSITISIYYIDQYFYRKLHDSYLYSCDYDYDKSDEDVDIWVKTTAALKKSR